MKITFTLSIERAKPPEPPAAAAPDSAAKNAVPTAPSSILPDPAPDFRDGSYL